MQLKSRHQCITVTVGDVTHTVELDQAKDGWWCGDVRPDVAEKCVAVAPGEYQVLEASVGEPLVQDSAPDVEQPAKPQQRKRT